jgi:ATP-binding cassette subfamily B protein
MRKILQGRTTLLITHRLAQIRRADRILLLKNGSLIAEGTHAELIANSAAYQQIFAPRTSKDHAVAAATNSAGALAASGAGE